MDLDTTLAEAAPARRTSLAGPDSPAATSLYQRITAPPAAPAATSRRLRLSVLAAASAAAAGVAAAVALTVIPSSPALAAWTVTKTPDGLVTVTIHQLRDPAGLTQRLRADGVSANVRFLTHQFTPTTSTSTIPRSCRTPRMSDSANADLQSKIMPGPFGHAYAAPGSISTGFVKARPGVALTIRPSAIPSQIGLYLEAYAAPGARGNSNFALQANLVLASPRCTGS
jgi:hypothetical protein